MKQDTLILAHYYAPIGVQRIAHYVGDSLELAKKAQQEDASRIVFAGVRFMAETAKVLNPEATIILPDWNSTCSLVEQTDIDEMRQWREKYADSTHVMYINSSVQQKALADWIVTSRNVEPVVSHLLSEGKDIIFSPDKNMGIYLNRKLGVNMPVWTAVCEVHDKFDRNRMEERYAKHDSDKRFMIAHPESPIGILDMADFVSSTKGMLSWVDEFDGPEGSVIYIATENELVEIMKERRPDLSIWQVPVIGNCRCNECPYMKLNIMSAVKKAIDGSGGTVIDYISEHDMEAARKPIERMMQFS